MRYAFVETGTYDESAQDSVNVNIGKDFARDDSYSLGNLVFTSDGDDLTFGTADDWTREWGAGMVVLRRGSYGADVDGDNVADPIFTLEGSRLTINIWMMRIVGNNKPLLINTRSTIALRN